VRSRLREQFSTTLHASTSLPSSSAIARGLKMNELSRLLMVTGGNVTPSSTSWRRRTRRAAGRAADRRAFRIRLTRAGSAASARWRARNEEWVVELLAGLSRREHEELLKLLAKVKQHALEVTS